MILAGTQNKPAGRRASPLHCCSRISNLVSKEVTTNTLSAQAMASGAPQCSACGF